MIRLEFPNLSQKYEYITMIEKWGNSEKIPISPNRLFAGDSFEDFLKIIENDRDNGRLPGVPASLFFLMEDKKIFGAIAIWHHTDHPELIEGGSHISYGICPAQRGKGYAKEMLRLGLIEASRVGLQRVCITCDDDNIASAKVIEANGGVFERYIEKDGKKGRRYWINLS